MKPILFIVFLALGPALGAQITPTLAKVDAPTVVVGEVERLPDRDDTIGSIDAERLRGHDAMAHATTTRGSVEGAR